MEAQMILKNISFLTLMTLFLAISTVAFANKPVENKKCIAELEKICPNLTFGHGLGKCIISNKSKFTKECQEKVEKGKTQVKAAFKKCQDDVQEFCSEIEFGEGRIVKCLRQNEEKISSTCRSYLEKVPM